MLSQAWESDGHGTMMLITCTKHPELREYREYWPNQVELNQILAEHIKKLGV
jgi:hypothetical protein